MASRSKSDCNEILVDAYEKSCVIYLERYPNAPQPFLTCTYRPNEEQTMLFNQPKDGKDNNGNGIIDDASEKVTWAKAGESPHNYKPAPALDVAFINAVTQKLDWGLINFKRFAEIMIEVQPLVRWGGDWDGDGITTDEKKPDAPHFELKDWRKYVGMG